MGEKKEYRPIIGFGVLTAEGYVDVQDYTRNSQGWTELLESPNAIVHDGLLITKIRGTFSPDDTNKIRRALIESSHSVESGDGSDIKAGYRSVRNVYAMGYGPIYYNNFAEYIAKTKTQDELAQFISGMFLAIEHVRDESRQRIETARKECPFVKQTGTV